MPPAPLVQLKDIALTFGGTPLLESMELSVQLTYASRCDGLQG